MLQNTNTEVVQVWRAWYFCRVKSIKVEKEGGKETSIVHGHTQDSEQEKEQR